MKISPTARVKYAHNPLAEVLCQIRFENIENFSTVLESGLRSGLIGKGYSVEAKEQELTFNIMVSPEKEVSLPPRPMPMTSIFHFSSEDSVWKISICESFLAVTCTAYDSWETFKPRVVDVCRLLGVFYPETRPVRIGLRYKDVIERDPLGLSDVPWSRLISPFLLGPLAMGALSDDIAISEDDAENFVSQAQFSLDDCKLLLQSSLLTSSDGSKRAFLIDADFFEHLDPEEELLSDSGTLESHMDVLHNNAGALFRRSITEELHAALSPQ